MKLIFFRHAIAAEKKDSHSFMDDFRREITGKGKRETKRVVKKFKGEFKSLKTIFTSPLSRAVQTAEIISKYNPDIPLEIMNSLDSSSSIADFVYEVNKLKYDEYCFVGHEPHLTLSISALLGLQTSVLELRKSGYVVLEGETLKDLKITRMVSPDLI